MIRRIRGGQHTDGVLVVAGFSERGPQSRATVRVEEQELVGPAREPLRVPDDLLDQIQARHQVRLGPGYPMHRIVVAQLGAWRMGARTATAPDCMAQVANALAADDLRPLGAYLASQGADRSLQPAPAASFVLPKACGTMPSEAKP